MRKKLYRIMLFENSLEVSFSKQFWSKIRVWTDGRVLAIWIPSRIIVFGNHKTHKSVSFDSCWAQPPKGGIFGI